MAESNAYSNPQKIVNKQFEILRKARIQQQKNWMGTMQQIQRRNIQKKQAQQIRYQKGIEQKARMENSVSGFSQTGFDVFDNNIRKFWDSKVDDYFEIKNGISTGEIDAVRGKAALAKINQQVLNYKQAVTPVLKLATAYNEASQLAPGSPGSVSATTDQDLQEVLGGIGAGGNVNIVDREGELFLYMPGSTPDTGSSVQISDLMKLESVGDALILQSDTSEYDNKTVDSLLQPDNTQSAYITTSYLPNGDNTDNEDMYRQVDGQQKLSLKRDLYKQGAYSKRVEDNKIMSPLWMDKYNDKEVIKKAYEEYGETIKIENSNGNLIEFNPRDFDDTTWGIVPSNLSQEQKDVWEKAQRVVARHVMINTTVDTRLAELGYEDKKYVGTEKKRKFNNPAYNNRHEEIDAWIAFANSGNGEDVDAAKFVDMMNHASRSKEFRVLPSGTIMKGSKEYVIDLSKPREVAYALGSAHSVREGTMAQAYEKLP